MDGLMISRHIISIMASANKEKLLVRKLGSRRALQAGLAAFLLNCMVLSPEGDTQLLGTVSVLH